MSNLVKKEKQQALALNDLNSVMSMAEVVVKSGRMSRDWNLETTAMVVMYAQEIGMSPMKAVLTGFDVIQGKIQMKPIMMAEMVRAEGHTFRIEKWEKDECIISGKRKDTGEVLTVKYTYKDAEMAGMTAKDNYKKNPKNMLYARAMGNLCRMLFTDVIGGAYAEGEFEEYEEKPEKKHSISHDTQTLTIQAEEIFEEEEQIEEKPKPVFIAPETLHQAMDVIGYQIPIESLKEFIFAMAQKKEMSQEFLVQAVMENDESIQNFINLHKKWIESKQKPSM